MCSTFACSTSSLSKMSHGDESESKKRVGGLLSSRGVEKVL
jgi:hypothetical protein